MSVHLRELMDPASTKTGPYTRILAKLASPGPTPEENLMFLSFVCHQGRFRACRPIVGFCFLRRNDLRLDGPEAPPSIISVFTGSRLSKVLMTLKIQLRRKRNEQVSDLMHLGISEIPELLIDNTDRNRTSPFAFTGNKFELRTVGASANGSQSMAILNVMVAQALRRFKKRVDSKVNRGRGLEAAVLDMLREYISESKKIRFEGDSYTKDWRVEAERRGLYFSRMHLLLMKPCKPKAKKLLVDSWTLLRSRAAGAL